MHLSRPFMPLFYCFIFIGCLIASIVPFFLLLFLVQFAFILSPFFSKSAIICITPHRQIHWWDLVRLFILFGHVYLEPIIVDLTIFI
ncbi:hypothetical protein BCR41DRAFT_181094 [Lobosporangium transversale]|uniref:Uncharacterized protein n=1 Tax=Lobosporangium transversale TaxID=64571 RepID=A0A1Y2GZ60_9FUNG|nr:hypothetical protein BCR41DRAFT_181094 [Lobosporangium transversale]ORZ27041.1 hypothetical protein BCR41DRAFT_181094 [Lobosporangium transversale]|eukprot:XP_021884788.1 hypothetical protein BCR41DRAFT_181094 [Lobosporangium transversale]